MCSIIGYFNYKNSVSKTYDALNKIKYRGLDSFGVYSENNLIYEEKIENLKEKIIDDDSLICMGHSLLSLVNFVPQPLIDNTNYKSNIFISNCEIYNWRELDEKYGFKSKNDSELLFNLISYYGISNIQKTLNEIDGVYAFAYFDKVSNKLILARDLLGVKPLFISYKRGKSICFASESKALIDENHIGELDPKQILEYDVTNNIATFINRDFYHLDKELKDSYSELKEETKKLLINSIRKRLPSEDKKVGLLFSGGIDSTFIAYVLKQLKVPFICYTAKTQGGNIKEAEDLIYAKEIAEIYGFELKIAVVNTDELEIAIKEVMEIIEDNEYIKTSVALPFYLSCIKAKEDNIKVIFSGLGSEEIFAGYKRHKESKTPNQECVNGLSIIHIRDLYRDDCITMSQNMEIRLPFLDKELIEYALNIPEGYKLNLKENRTKIILREIAFDMGLDIKYSERQKKAAQYGSKFDKGVLRLAKNRGMNRQDYLDMLYYDK